LQINYLQISRLFKAPQNYQDCTLKEAKKGFKILDNNLMMLSFVQTLIILVVVAFLLKVKKKKIIFWEEDIHFIGKMFYFMFLFNFSDLGLQCYKEFIERPE